MRRALALLASLALALTACSMPQDDPEGTLEAVRGNVLRVGVTDVPPWVTGPDGVPGGVEARLVRAFADHLDAEVSWHPGTADEVLGALEHRELHLVAAGLTKQSPWAKHVALTSTYLTTYVLVGFPPGEPVPDAIDGLPVAALEGTRTMGLLRRTQAQAVPVDHERELAGRRAAVTAAQLYALGLQPSNHVLDEVHHVLAVPQGENQFLVELERFLRELGNDTIATWLREEATA